MNSLQRLTATVIGVAPQLLSREQLGDYQLTELRKTLLYAKRNSIFYKKHLPQEGLLQLETLTDFEAIPFTNQEDIKGNLEAFFCVSPDEISRIVTLQTSGSTGLPKRIGFTHGDIESTIQFFEYGMQELTSAGKKVMICMPGSREYGVSDLLYSAITRFGGVPMLYGAISNLDHAAAFIKTNQPHCIVGIPVQVLRLACFIKAQGADNDIHIESVLLSSDYLADSLRRRVEAIFDCKVYNHYGSTETGYGAALECAAHHGMHLRDTDLFFEVVDPLTGKPLADGRLGEVAVTTLGRLGMPLIRYRTGDFARYLQEDCACGSPLPRITSPFRRDKSQLDLPGGRLDLHLLDEELFCLDWLTDYELSVSQGAPPNLSLKYWQIGMNPQRDNDFVAALYDVLQGPAFAQPLAGLSVEVIKASQDTAPPCLRGKRIINQAGEKMAWERE